MSANGDHDSAADTSPMDVDTEMENPGAYPEINGGINHQETDIEDSPVPPQHKSPPPPPKPSIDPEACKALGNKYFKARDYTKAIAEYTKGEYPCSIIYIISNPSIKTHLTILRFLPALSVESQSVTYLSNRAAAFMSANRYEEALEDSRTADNIDPKNAKVLSRIARIYISTGRPAEALEILDRISSFASVTPQDQSAASSMQSHIKQAEEAIREGTSGFMAIHALDRAEQGLGTGTKVPRRWQLLRGEAFLKMGNVNALGKAQDVAMSLLRKNSKDPEALVLRGRALYGQGDNEKALQHFREALNCDPDYKDGVKYLRMVQKLDRVKEEGNAAFKGRRYRQAVDVYTQALEIDPGNKGTNSKILQNRAMASINVHLRPVSSTLLSSSY